MTEPKYRDWSNYSPGALGLVRFRTLILIIRSADHIVKSLTFLELVRILNPSVPYLVLLFPSLPPPLLIPLTAFQSGCRLVFRLNLKTLTALSLHFPSGGRKRSPSPLH